MPALLKADIILPFDIDIKMSNVKSGWKHTLTKREMSK